MLRKLLFFFLFLGIGISAVTAYSIWQYNLPLVSPLALIEIHLAPPKPQNKIVYGFLPYWNLKHANELNIKNLTHLAYFAIDLEEDGQIKTKVNTREAEPGWIKSRSAELAKVLYQVKLLNIKTVLTITAMDPETIEGILNDSEHQNQAISSSLSIYKDYSYDSINVDFEYVGEPDETTRQNFTKFVTDLKKSCQVINPKCEIDIDIFGDTANKRRLWDLKSLQASVDHVIVMAYDYYRKSSTQAGPVAPLRGACDQKGFSALLNQGESCLEHDITSNIADISTMIPLNKVILGVPFYGYIWQTASTEYLANTYPKTGGAIFYRNIRELFTDDKISSLSAKWSDRSLSPYLSYEEDGKTYQVQYEDAQSLELKTKLVSNSGMAGLAIWAIGYEVPYLDIWQPISDYLLQTSD